VEDDKTAGDNADTIRETYNVLVELDDEAAQVALIERLTAEGYQCRSLIS
jgi:hypothetical protein